VVLYIWPCEQHLRSRLLVVPSSLDRCHFRWLVVNDILSIEVSEEELERQQYCCEVQAHAQHDMRFGGKFPTQHIPCPGVAPHIPATVAFVPAHPVAGTEQSGPAAGFASLFLNRWSILTPIEGTNPKAIARLTAFWKGAGANVEVMDAAHHDLVLAITSHVPHLIAYNIVGTAADLEEVTRSEVIKFSAGGFRDFTRIAASDPVMWRDIFLNNREAVLEMLGRFNEDLIALQKMIRNGDGKGLVDLFTRTRAIRRGIIEQGQETDLPDFGRHAGEI
jgi:cyclohexadieny/prephenate dehydrogenase